MVSNIILIGNTMCGKTTFFRRIKNQEPVNYLCTIGVELYKTVDQFNNIIRLYDSPGRKLFRSLLVSYIKCSHVFVLFFLVNKEKTFKDLDDWVSLVNTHNPNPKFILIGNITTNKRIISKPTAINYATKIDALYYELSVENDSINHIILDNQILSCDNARALARTQFLCSCALL